MNLCLKIKNAKTGEVLNSKPISFIASQEYSRKLVFSEAQGH